jgi:16S rRNA (cytosine967-C5)-methyltransferase
MASGLPSARLSNQSPSARAVALAVLADSVKADEGVDVLLDRALARSSLDSRDRALAMELTYGVLRRLATIDWRLEPLLDKPLPRLPILVQMILRLGAYQIIYLDRIPHSAAVNESVQLAKQRVKTLGRDWGGFVNAVLRSLLRSPVLPWPTVETDAARALSVRYSIPEWLSQRWIDRLGVTRAEVAAEAASAIPPVTLRTNQMKTTRDALLATLHAVGLKARATEVSPIGIILEDGGTVPSLPGFQEGAFYVEDEAAQLIPPLLDPQPGEVVLDACAAPGGKTTHLALLMQNRGVVYAVDRKAERLEWLRDNCRRLGIEIVTPVVGDIRQPNTWSNVAPAQDGCFDRILVDAPCSGLGVLRRHPEAKWRKDSQAFARHQAHQRQILDAVVPRLRAGGVLVYSTCSTEPEENEDVIEQLCRSYAGFRLESVAPWLPPAAHIYLTEQGALSTMGNRHSMDAFYAARLIKVS